MHNILITGGAGFIGRNLVNRLLFSYQGNHGVTVIDNLSNRRSKYPHLSDNKTLSEHGKRLAFYEEDIRDTRKVSDIIKHEKIDTCVHLAAKVSVLESLRDPTQILDVNSNGTLSMLEACSQNKITKFIFASSAAVYGSPFRLPSSEKHPVEPLSPYAASKVAGEALVSSYRNSGKIENAISLRIFNVYGKGQNPSYAGVITRFARRLSRKLPPLIYGDGTQTRDFISVDDVVNCIILAAKKQKNTQKVNENPIYVYPREVFNVGTGIATSINTLADKMIKISGLDVKPVHRTAVNERSEVKDSYAHTKKATELLRFKPQKVLEDGLKDVLSPR
jgi:UDP-glucose 4-epimerase